MDCKVKAILQSWHDTMNESGAINDVEASIVVMTIKSLTKYCNNQIVINPHPRGRRVTVLSFFHFINILQCTKCIKCMS